VKKIFFDLKLWGPLKNFKTGGGPKMSKNGMKISLDCPFKVLKKRKIPAPTLSNLKQKSSVGVPNIPPAGLDPNPGFGADLLN
jgi:hypothetical protein